MAFDIPLSFGDISRSIDTTLIDADGHTVWWIVRYC